MYSGGFERSEGVVEAARLRPDVPENVVRCRAVGNGTCDFLDGPFRNGEICALVISGDRHCQEERDTPTVALQGGLELGIRLGVPQLFQQGEPAVEARHRERIDGVVQRRRRGRATAPGAKQDRCGQNQRYTPASTEFETEDGNPGPQSRAQRPPNTCLRSGCHLRFLMPSSRFRWNLTPRTRAGQLQAATLSASEPYNTRAHSSRSNRTCHKSTVSTRVWLNRRCGCSSNP